MKFSVNLKSLLARFLFINLFFFSILTLATYSYLQSIEPELVGNKKKEHSKLIKNIALNMELQRIPYKRDNLKIFLANYKYLLPNINQIRIYDLKKEIIVDTHSLDINAKPFYKVPDVQERKLTIDNIPDTSDLTTQQEEKILNKIINDNLSILGSDKVLTFSRKIKNNFVVVSLSSLTLNSENKGFIVISEDSNDIENAIVERKNFVIRTVLSVAAIILIFSIFLNANIIKPIRILGRYATSASSDNPDNKIINRINLRRDEIGNLSRSLSGMTDNLYKRIEFAERFASDLTHEIRNPLASLKAASELLPNAKDAEKKTRLLGNVSASGMSCWIRPNFNPPLHEIRRAAPPSRPPDFVAAAARTLCGGENSAGPLRRQARSRVCLASRGHECGGRRQGASAGDDLAAFPHGRRSGSPRVAALDARHRAARSEVEHGIAGHRRRLQQSRSPAWRPTLRTARRQHCAHRRGGIGPSAQSTPHLRRRHARAFGGRHHRLHVESLSENRR